MKKTFTIIISLLIISCGPTSSIVSNKSKDFNSTIDQVLIIISGAKRSSNYLNLMGFEISIALENRGIKYDIHYVDPLALETDKEIKTIIDSFNPKYYLIMRQAETHINSGYGASIGFIFDFQLYTVENEKMVWRSSLGTSTSGSLDKSAEDAINTLFKKLEEDQIVTTFSTE